MRNELERCRVDRFALQVEIGELKLKITKLEEEIKLINREWAAEVRDYEEQLWYANEREF